MSISIGLRGFSKTGSGGNKGVGAVCWRMFAILWRAFVVSPLIVAIFDMAGCRVQTQSQAHIGNHQLIFVESHRKPLSTVIMALS